MALKSCNNAFPFLEKWLLGTSAHNEMFVADEKDNLNKYHRILDLDSVICAEKERNKNLWE